MTLTVDEARAKARQVEESKETIYTDEFAEVLNQILGLLPDSTKIWDLIFLGSKIGRRTFRRRLKDSLNPDSVRKIEKDLEEWTAFIKSISSGEHRQLISLLHIVANRHVNISYIRSESVEILCLKQLSEIQAVFLKKAFALIEDRGK